MRRVEVDAEFVTTKNDADRPCAGVKVTCSRCDKEVCVIGDSVRSYRRAYARLREECPRGESNYYACDDEPEDET